MTKCIHALSYCVLFFSVQTAVSILSKGEKKIQSLPSMQTVISLYHIFVSHIYFLSFLSWSVSEEQTDYHLIYKQSMSLKACLILPVLLQHKTSVTTNKMKHHLIAQHIQSPCMCRHVYESFTAYFVKLYTNICIFILTLKHFRVFF